MKSQIALPTAMVLLAFFSICHAQDKVGNAAMENTRATSDSKWSGWYFGLGLGANRTSTDISYRHVHAGNCVNLNFGSEWPGDNCEGNQDYANDFDSNRTGLSGSLKIGRNWMLGQWLAGVVGDITLTKSPSQNVTRILSNTWGDSLNISVKQGDYFSIRTIVGKPNGDYLPYATLGVSAAEIKTSITQDQPGYTSRSFENSPHKLACVIGGGIKHLVNDRLIIGAEYLHSAFSASSLDQGNVILSGGIRFPDTYSETKIVSDIMNITVEYKF